MIKTFAEWLVAMTLAAACGVLAAGWPFYPL